MDIHFYDVPVEGKGKVTPHGKTLLKFTFPCGEVRHVKRAKLAALLNALNGAAPGVEIEAWAWNAIRNPDGYSWRSDWSDLRVQWANPPRRTFVHAMADGGGVRFRYEDLGRAVAL